MYAFNSYRTNYFWRILPGFKDEQFTQTVANYFSCRFLFRSSCPEVFCKKGVLKYFAKFTGKHLCQSPFFDKVAGLRKFWEIFKNTFSYRTPLVAASAFWGALKINCRIMFQRCWPFLRLPTWNSISAFKVGPSPSKWICFDESPLKWWKMLFISS